MFYSKIFESGNHGIVFVDENVVVDGVEKYKNEEISKWLAIVLDFMEK